MSKAQGLFDQVDKQEESIKKEGGVNNRVMKQRVGFTKLGLTLKNFKLKDKGGYITKEFQDYGYRLAVTLNDTKRASLYIKLAQTVDRVILEQALSFIADARDVKSKSRLFMWKVKQLRIEREKND